MLGWCCQQSHELKEELFIYRGNNQKLSRSLFSISQLNPKIAKEGEQYQVYVSSNYDNLLKACMINKQQFFDREFDTRQQKSSKREGRKIVWRRLKTFADSKFVLFQTRSINQIVILNKNDSYFLPTIAALAQHRSIVSNILNGVRELNQFGIYQLNVCINGKPKQVVVDDLIPVFEDNQQKTAFCKAQNGSLWILLLEKAYAKIKIGYDNIQSGYAHQVLTTFTVAPCLYFIIPLKFDHESQEGIWHKIAEAKKNNFPVLCGSRKQYTCEGILMNQTYPFVDCWVQQIKQRRYRMIKLANISGVFDHSDDCKIEMCNEGEMIQLDLVEFMRNFQVMDIANIRPSFSSYFYRYTSHKSQYKFYTVQVPQPTSCYLTLHKQSQHLGKLRIFLARVLQNQRHYYDYELVDCKIQQIFSDASLECTLQKGSYIVCCQSSIQGNCFLRIYSPISMPFQETKQQGINFIEKICQNIAHKNRQDYHMLTKNSNDWYYAKILFEQIGLAFIIISLDATSNVKCSVTYKKDKLEEEGFTVINKKESTFKAMRGQKLVLIFQIINNRREYLQFPPKSLQIKVII